MTDISDMITLAEVGKEISVTAQTVTQWLNKHNEIRDNSFDGEGAILALVQFGNTRVFSRKQLLELAAEQGNGAAVKAAGYVHPDKFKESEDARIRLAAELAEMHASQGELKIELDYLRKQYANAADELGWTHSYHQYKNDAV